MIIISMSPAKGRSQDAQLLVLDQDPHDPLNYWRILETLSVSFLAASLTKLD